LEALLVSSLAQTDALARLLIEKGLITREEFMQKISEERATYQKNPQPYPAIDFRHNAYLEFRLMCLSLDSREERTNHTAETLKAFVELQKKANKSK